MKLEWADSAIADLRKIDNWLNVRASSEVAEDQIDRVRKQARRLLSFPRRKPLVGDRHRYAQVERTPYVIIYVISQDRVSIVRIRHNREDWRVP